MVLSTWLGCWVYLRPTVHVFLGPDGKSVQVCQILSCWVKNIVLKDLSPPCNWCLCIHRMMVNQMNHTALSYLHFHKRLSVWHFLENSSKRILLNPNWVHLTEPDMDVYTGFSGSDIYVEFVMNL